jgi:hypothetical protein
MHGKLVLTLAVHQFHGPIAYSIFDETKTSERIRQQSELEIDVPKELIVAVEGSTAGLENCMNSGLQRSWTEPQPTTRRGLTRPDWAGRGSLILPGDFEIAERSSPFHEGARMWAKPAIVRNTSPGPIPGSY